MRYGSLIVTSNVEMLLRQAGHRNMTQSGNARQRRLPEYHQQVGDPDLIGVGPGPSGLHSPADDMSAPSHNSGESGASTELGGNKDEDAEVGRFSVTEISSEVDEHQSNLEDSSPAANSARMTNPEATFTENSQASALQLYAAVEKSTKHGGVIFSRKGDSSPVKMQTAIEGGSTITESIDIYKHIKMMLSANDVSGLRDITDDTGQPLRSPVYRHIEKMLSANDVPGLQFIAEEGGPLNSLITALKIGKNLLDQHAPEHFVSSVGTALTALRNFYIENPALFELGDASAFSSDRPRDQTEIDKLMDEITEGTVLLGNLNRALSDDPGPQVNDESKNSRLQWQWVGGEPGPG